MIQKLPSILIGVCLVFFSVAAASAPLESVYAQGGGSAGNGGGQGGDTVGGSTSGNNGVTQGTYTDRNIPVSIDNPLSSDIGTLEDLVQALLTVLIIIAAPIVVIFIILAGFKYVTAQGDPGKLEEAKKALLYAIIGGILIIGATAIFEIIVNTIDAFRN